MTTTPTHRTGWTNRVPRIFSTVLALVAVICALAATSLVFRHGVRPVQMTIDRLLLPAPANLAYAAFIGVVAAAVSRRKRVAWWVLLGYFGLQFLGDLLLGLFLGIFAHDPEALIDAAGRPLGVPGLEVAAVLVNGALSLAALIVLLLARREFYARVQHASLRRALVVFGVGAIISTGLGYLMVTAFPGSLHGAGDRFTWAAERVLGGAVTFDVTRMGRAPAAVNFALGLLGALTLFAALFTLFRSQRAAAVLLPASEARIRRLLTEHGERDSLGYFATRRDKLAIFSPSGKAAVTYRVVGGVSLASADPIGDPEAWGPAIDAWLADADAYAWTPAVMGASEEGAKAYARAGLRVIELGDEAIIHVHGFTLHGRDMRVVRQAVNRVRRAGYTTRIRRHADVPPDEMAHAVALADAWRDTETERGFSMALGRLGDPADGRCVLVECLDGEGRPAALLSFAPWGTRGLSLDLMRRDRSADNGVMELMVSAVVEAAPTLGVDRISLNFAVFRSVFEEGARIGAGPILRMWRSTLLFFSRWWQLESLYRANQKYQPEWVPRFVCFRDRRELARIGLASASAEGFLAIPGLAGRLRGPAVAPPARPTPAAEEVAAAAHPLEVEEEERRPEQERVRLAKLTRLRESGTDPYPLALPVTDTLRSIRDRYPDLPPDTGTGETVSVAGRVLLARDHGTLCFATIRDWSADLQIMLAEETVGADGLARWRADVDLGDQVAVTGEVITTRRGELTVRATDWTMTAKCLRPLPDKRHGLADPEARVRQRYVDLAVNPQARTVLRTRSAVVRALREHLHDAGFLEVETPMLQRVHGGANARPFGTHINAYDMALYLRIAPELYLKRLCVGGVDRVFEIGRAFRNEGVDATHNPEFTVLEAYQAHADYETMRLLTQDMIVAAARAAHGEPVLHRDGVDYDLAGDWPVRTVHDAVSVALGEQITPDSTAEHLRKLCDAAGIPYKATWGQGALVLEMYERLVEASTAAPTFYTDFPVEVSPLTRPHRSDPRLAERWDLVAFGVELGTAYSELTDPIEQRRRLTAQSLLAAGGDAEAMELDEDFLAALEYGMPPTGGLGLGVDRIVMLLTGLSIRETLPFPLVRPGGR